MLMEFADFADWQASRKSGSERPVLGFDSIKKRRRPPYMDQYAVGVLYESCPTAPKQCPVLLTFWYCVLRYFGGLAGDSRTIIEGENIKC